MSSFLNLLSEYIPNDHSHQVTSLYYTECLFKQNSGLYKVMDLGCGAGDSLGYFKEKYPNVIWTGLDINKSPEIEEKIKIGGEFHIYDGIHIPFEDNYFDLIFCNQVFEHVRFPADLLKEVKRVLKPNGYFIGSASQLEPYHSYSLWNYTPYGFSVLIKEAGLQLLEIRPGIDALTLILRRGFGCTKIFSRWMRKESPLNLIISLIGRVKRKSNFWINARKLLFCGHFCFLVRKESKIA